MLLIVFAIVVLVAEAVQANSFHCQHTWDEAECRQHFRNEFERHLLENHVRSLERLLRDYIEIYEVILIELPEEEQFYRNEVQRFLHEFERMLRSLEHIKHDPHKIRETVREVKQHLKAIIENRRFESITNEAFQEILEKVNYERLAQNNRLAAKEEKMFLMEKWMQLYNPDVFPEYSNIHDNFLRAREFDNSQEREEAFQGGYQSMMEEFETPDWLSFQDIDDFE